LGGYIRHTTHNHITTTYEATLIINVIITDNLHLYLYISYSYVPPKHSEQTYHEIKESNTLKGSTITKCNVTEPAYDLIDREQKSHDDVNMSSNPAYDISKTVKMEDNPAYSLSGDKAVESDYM